MNIDRSSTIAIIDFDNQLYDLLKSEYTIIKHTNNMQDIIDYSYKFDYLVADSIYQDGDIFELVKHIKYKPLLIDDLSDFFKKKLKNKVIFVNRDDFFLKENYIGIQSELKGYKLALECVKELSNDIELLGKSKALYKRISDESTQSTEKLIRYYKEYLYNNSILDNEGASFNKTYPTNVEFLKILLDLYKQKKIKVD